MAPDCHFLAAVTAAQAQARHASPMSPSPALPIFPQLIEEIPNSQYSRDSLNLNNAKEVAVVYLIYPHLDLKLDGEYLDGQTLLARLRKPLTTKCPK